jgi:flavodoxin
MNSLVVYYSEFGNTARIAEAIVEVLEPAGSARVLDLKRLDVLDLRSLDLLVVGVPTHRMNIPKVAHQLIKAFPRGTLPKRASVAAFDTSYRLSFWLRPFSASHALLPRLKRLGGEEITPPMTFHVSAKEGPLDDGEIERAKAWTQEILKEVEGRSNR